MDKNNVYLYVRYSNDKVENESIDFNVNEFLAKHYMYVVMKRFEDSPDSEDKGLIDLMNYARINEKVKKIIAFSRKNVSSDDIFVMWIEKELMKTDIRFRFINEKFLENHELEVLRDKIIGAFARYERDKLPNKLAAHREYKIFETGIKASGNCPIGYRYFGKKSKDKKVIVVAEEAEIVRLIFNKYIEFKSLGHLKDYLEESGIVTRRTKKFSRQALYNILTNKFYIGLLSYNHYKYISVAGQPRKKAILVEERRIEGKHEKIISRELFEEVNRVLQENNKHKND